MPRPKNVTPTTPVKAYLDQDNAAELLLRTHSAILGRNRYGDVSRIINDALREYFKRQKESGHVQP
jgi:hypothetical protein